MAGEHEPPVRSRGEPPRYRERVVDPENPVPVRRGTRRGRDGEWELEAYTPGDPGSADWPADWDEVPLRPIRRRAPGEPGASHAGRETPESRTARAEIRDPGASGDRSAATRRHRDDPDTSSRRPRTAPREVERSGADEIESRTARGKSRTAIERDRPVEDQEARRAEARGSQRGREPRSTRAQTHGPATESASARAVSNGTRRHDAVPATGRVPAPEREVPGTESATRASEPHPPVEEARHPEHGGADSSKTTPGQRDNARGSDPANSDPNHAASSNGTEPTRPHPGHGAADSAIEHEGAHPDHGATAPDTGSAEPELDRGVDGRGTESAGSRPERGGDGRGAGSGRSGAERGVDGGGVGSVRSEVRGSGSAESADGSRAGRAESQRLNMASGASGSERAGARGADGTGAEAGRAGRRAADHDGTDGFVAAPEEVPAGDAPGTARPRGELRSGAGELPGSAVMDNDETGYQLDVGPPPFTDVPADVPSGNGGPRRKPNGAPGADPRSGSGPSRRDERPRGESANRAPSSDRRGGRREPLSGETAARPAQRRAPDEPTVRHRVRGGERGDTGRTDRSRASDRPLREPVAPHPMRAPVPPRFAGPRPALTGADPRPPRGSSRKGKNARAKKQGPPLLDDSTRARYEAIARERGGLRAAWAAFRIRTDDLRRANAMARYEAIVEDGFERDAQPLTDRGYLGPGGGRMSVVGRPVEYRATTAQVAGLWPWSVGAGAPLIGTPLGSHLHTGAPVCFDPMNWFMRGSFITAPSLFVLGLNGFGKSSLVRRIVLGGVAQGITPLILADVKPDYRKMVEMVGGQVIDLGYGHGVLNPLAAGVLGSIVPRLADVPALQLQVTQELRARQVTLVAGLVELVRGARVRDYEETLISTALRILYREGSGYTPDNPPIMENLADVITAGGQELMLDAGAESSEEYHEATKGLRRSLRALTQGPFGAVFNGQTTTPIDTSAVAVCIDVSHIPQGDKKLKAAVMLSCWADGFASVEAAHVLADAKLGPQRYFQVVMDELWQVLGLGDFMVDRVDELTRLQRGLATSLIMISHTIKDLQSLGSEAAIAKALGFLERARAKIFGALPPEEIKRLDSTVPFTAAEEEMVTGWSAPQALTGEALKPGQARPPAPGTGKFLLKIGEDRRPGIPFHMEFTASERESGIHETNQRFSEFTESTARTGDEGSAA
ncbi:hypothetical protein [Nocardia wallacei]|uniref:hypothetical protein n=1 Tax=Nocardia wallacei TaxID=480035 RepID=UPI00245627BD|nr:hypothetical protein [Nocardia wallacei]